VQFVLVGLNLGQAKISNLHNLVVASAGAQQILRLQIAMRDILQISKNEIE
jgi:hypothetical protein